MVTLAENVALVPLSELDPHEAGRRLHQMIYGGRGGTPDPWIADDFPQIVRNYVTPERAEARVRELVRIVQEEGEDRGLFAVTQDDTVIGLATYGQVELVTRRGIRPFRKTTSHANGPCVACWLARPERRPRPRLPMLPIVLRDMAQLVAANTTLHGRPWTLVRVNRRDYGYVDRALMDVNNGFGGFDVQETGSWPQVDGVAEERKLYVGGHLVQSLRG